MLTGARPLRSAARRSWSTAGRAANPVGGFSRTLQLFLRQPSTEDAERSGMPFELVRRETSRARTRLIPCCKRRGYRLTLNRGEDPCATP
jgi:hypothetical protein